MRGIIIVNMEKRNEQMAELKSEIPVCKLNF